MLGLISGAAESAPVTSGVVVKIEPAKITRRTFDPENPPPEMPRLRPPEIGTCVYTFHCTTEMETRGALARPAQLTGVEVSAKLTVTLWTPRDGPPKVLAHEEGHRAICEIFYDRADSVARRLAEREIGRTLNSAMQDKRAVEAELKRIQDDLIAAFLRETATRCDFAGERFDVITEHSKNPISESDAITQALAEERSAYARTNGLKPEEVTAGIGVPLRVPPTRPER